MLCIDKSSHLCSQLKTLYIYIFKILYLFKIFTNHFLRIYSRVGKTKHTNITKLIIIRGQNELKNSKNGNRYKSNKGYKNSEKQENEASRLIGMKSWPRRSACIMPEEWVALQMRKYTFMEIWNCKKPTLFPLLVNTSFGNLRLTSFQSSRSRKDECLPPSILPANQDGALGTWDHPSTILSRRMGYEDTPVSVQWWHGMDRQFLKENKTGGHSKMTAIYCTFTPALPLSLLDHKVHHDYPGQAASLLFLDHIMFVTDWKTKLCSSFSSPLESYSFFFPLYYTLSITQTQYKLTSPMRNSQPVRHSTLLIL